jgi:hypothetical protein
VDLRNFNVSKAMPQGQFAAPFCFELAGKTMSFPIATLTEETFTFSPVPEKTVTVGGETLPYYCAKAADAVLFVGLKKPDAPVYVVNLAAGFVLRVFADNAFGVVPIPGSELPKLDGILADFSGNAIEWTLGSDPGATVLAEYGANNALSLTLPGFPKIASSSFIAYKISDGVYIQAADIPMGPQSARLALLCDFNRDCFVGQVAFGGDMSFPIGGYATIKA